MARKNRRLDFHSTDCHSARFYKHKICKFIFFPKYAHSIVNLQKSLSLLQPRICHICHISHILSAYFVLLYVDFAQKLHF
ncbi:hypothetical protein [Helicobacter sp. T3_23-1059]